MENKKLEKYSERFDNDKSAIGNPDTWGKRLVEEPKLSNICIKCGVDLYYSPNFTCQEHPKNCKGIHLSEETLKERALKEEPFKHKVKSIPAEEILANRCNAYQFIDFDKQQTLSGFEEGHNDNSDWLEQNGNQIKQETLEESAEIWVHNRFTKQIKDEDIYASESSIVQSHILFAKFQQERSYSEEEVRKLAFDFYYDMSRKMNVPENLITENATNVDVWFEQFKNK
jgi:hypothetical protein